MVLIIYTKNRSNLTNRFGSGGTKSVDRQRQNYIPPNLLGDNKQEDLKVLKHPPDPNNVKIGQGQLRLIIQGFFIPISKVRYSAPCPIQNNLIFFPIPPKNSQCEAKKFAFFHAIWSVSVC